MGIVNINGGGFPFPEPNIIAANFGNPSGETSFLLDANGEKLGLVFQAPKNGNLAKLHILTGTVTTGDDLKISFQNINTATSRPDETADEFRVLTVGNGDDNTVLTTGIITSDGTDTGTKRAVTKGDVVCAVIEFNSYVAGNLNIAAKTGNLPFQMNGVHMCTLKTGGTWAAPAQQPLIAVEYDDGTFAWAPLLTGAVSRTIAEAFSNSSNPDERGNIINLSVPVRVTGLWAIGAFSVAADLVLYDTDGTTVLMTCPIGYVGANAVSYYGKLGSGTVDLAAGVNYRVVIKPATASTVTVYREQFGSVARLNQASGGSSIHMTTRNDATPPWTETNTSRYMCGILISGLHDGTGGGAGILINGGLIQ